MKLTGWRTGGAALLLAGMVLSQGCQKHAEPFADVSSRHRLEPTQSPAGTQPAGKPVVAEAEIVKTETAKTEVVRPEAVKIEPVQPAAVVVGEKPVLTRDQVAAPLPPKVSPNVPDEVGGLRRSWAVSTCYQPSGDILAGHTYYPSSKFKRPEWTNLAIEPGEFLLNTVLLPVRMVLAPPCQPVIYSPVGPAAKEHVLYGQPALETETP